MSDPLSRTQPAALQDSNDNTTFGGATGLGLGGLGSSTDSTLQAAYSVSPIFQDAFLFDKIKKTFQNTLDGTKSYITDFLQTDGTSGVNMDFSGAPSLGNAGTGAPDEKLPGETGSTIVASGLGPNVNINGSLQDVPATPELPEGAPADRAVVDVFPNGHYGTLGSIESPKAASAKSSYTIGEVYVPGTSPHYYNSVPAEGDE